MFQNAPVSEITLAFDCLYNLYECDPLSQVGQLIHVHGYRSILMIGSMNTLKIPT